MNGLLVIDKPTGVTSRDAVNAVQRRLPKGTKVGHTGTLDPLATGVLVVCLGAATRVAGYVQAMGKSYAARVRLGAASDSDDADGTVTEVPAAVPPSRAEIEAALGRFVGVIEQVPPAVSALKVNGRRAHDLARRGHEVSLAPRPVRVDAIRLVACEWPWVDIEVDCGKGTYIRSLARDLGAALGCGGLIQALRRTRVGPFTAEQGVAPGADLSAVPLQPPAVALGAMPPARVSAAEAARLRQGQRVAAPPAPAADGAEVAVFDDRGELVGVARVERGALKPHLIFAR